MAEVDEGGQSGRVLWTPSQRGSGWRFESADGPLLDVSGLTPNRGGLRAWVEVRWAGDVPAPRLLHASDRNLMGPTTASGLAKAAHDALPAVKFPWLEAITEAVYYVVTDHRAGVETVDLADVAMSDRPRWLLRPFIERAGATRLIAQGGSSKSLLAVAISAAVAGGHTRILGLRPQVSGPVLFLDWEADAETHAERLAAIATGSGTGTIRDVLYQRHKLPLYRSSESVARVADDEGAVMVVVDSAMLARGSSDGASAEDSTVRFFEALSEIGLPALILDHKNKEQIRSKGATGGYGSVVMTNSARVVWEVTRVVELPTDGELRIVLSMTKANNTRRAADVALSYRFESDEDRLHAVELRQIAPGRVIDLAEGETLPDRVASYLLSRDEPALVSEIALALAMKDNTVRAVLSRHGERFERANLEGKARWRVIGENRDDGQALPVPWSDD